MTRVWKRHSAFLALLLAAWALPVMTASAQVPIVFKVSEGVRPDSVLSLYGEYLTGATQVRFLKSDGSLAATQPAVQSDPAGHFCRVIFPFIPPGAYRLMVRNAAGWSVRPVFVNRAEPRWISEERAYPGLPLKLIGRNLDAGEYGGPRTTLVRLVPTGGSKPRAIRPEGVTPYCVDFTVPTKLASGRYFVEVRTGSPERDGEWRRLDDHSEYPQTVHDTVIRVEDTPADPEAIALHVTWANDFRWDRVVNAKTQCGAKGDGATDDTRAIQVALDRVRAGGGVVFLPNGNYWVSTLTLGDQTILRGESRAGTVLAVSGTGPPAIRMQGISQGISTLTLRYQAAVPAGSDGTLVGGSAAKTFLYNTTFDLLRNPDVSVSQSPYYFDGPGPLLTKRCLFRISHKNLWDHAVRSHVTFRDNVVDMHDGLGLCLSSEKLLVLHNELVFHPAAYAGQMNGFFLDEGWMGWNIYNAYVAGNNAHNLNGPGDCQPFAADSAWSCFAGSALASSAGTVDIRNDLSADFRGLDTHETEVIVVRGKGLGQLRRTVSHRNLGGSPAVVRFTVSPPWDMPPDSTSVLSVGSWHLNNVFSQNRAVSCKSPYNMYYGGSYDCVDTGADSQNTEGWYNWGRIGETPAGSWHCPVYFNQLRRSRFTGKSPAYGTMGLTVRVENETGTYRGIADYGTEIRDNWIDRADCFNQSQRLAGNAAIATFTQNWIKTAADGPLIVATLCDGNTIQNSAVGFDLKQCYAFAIRGTVYANCPTPIHDAGVGTLLLPDGTGPRKLLPPMTRTHLIRKHHG